MAEKRSFEIFVRWVWLDVFDQSCLLCGSSVNLRVLARLGIIAEPEDCLVKHCALPALLSFPVISPSSTFKNILSCPPASRSGMRMRQHTLALSKSCANVDNLKRHEEVVQRANR